MCEIQNQPLQLSFNPSLRIDFQGSRVTSDGGLLLVRELAERLGLGALHCQKHDERPARQEHSVAAPGSGATVHLQSRSMGKETVSLRSCGRVTCIMPRT